MATTSQAIQKSVRLTSDHIKRVSSTKPAAALCELIWNSLDADATQVQVFFHQNPLGGYDQITVTDNGLAMKRLDIERYLGVLGGSWKAKTPHTPTGRPIHGEKGEGRFKAFSLGTRMTWDSVYYDKTLLKHTQIVFDMGYSNKYDIHPQQTATQKHSGMQVRISNLHTKIAKVKLDDIKQDISKTFAFYLQSYPQVSLELNGEKIDTTQEIADTHSVDFEVEGVEGTHTLVIIEWARIHSKSLLLCKKNGAVLKEHMPKPYKIRPLGYSFSAYLCSEYLDSLNESNDLAMIELLQDGMSILSKTYELINQHFIDKQKQSQLERLEHWKKEGVYPFVDQDGLSELEEARREIFDMVASKVEDNLPKFAGADAKTKRFTFQLLSQAIQNNPESLQTIITEVLNLPKDEQDTFAQILHKSSLSSIIKSAKIIADRLDFLAGLEELIFNHTQSLLERDQLHKILEHEAWVFDEQFALAGSERRLEEALKLHLKHLGKRADDLSDVLLSDGRRGRLDLMLSKADEVRAGEFDYLVVELKRPSQKINADVITQIKNYAYALQEDSRFDKRRCRWKFIAVSNELDSFAKRELEGGSDGRIYRATGIEIYIMTWSQVITNAKARLKFYQEQLNYQSNDESSLAYLKEKHAEFLPTSLNTNE